MQDERLLLASVDVSIRRLEKTMKRAANVVDKASKTAGDRWEQSNKRMSRSSEQMARRVRQAVSLIALTAAGREVTQYADTFVNLNNKLAAASVVAGRQSRSLAALGDEARDARSKIEPYVDLYARILRGTRRVADSEEDVARATNLVSKAFAAGGAAASEQAAGVLQIGQALDSGFLQGDELRSIRENAPLVAKAIADFVGVSTGELKALGAEGKLTSEVVFNALLAGADDIEAAFGVTIPRASDASVLAWDNLVVKMGQFAFESGIVSNTSQALGDVLNFVANNLELFADIAVVATAAAVGFFGSLAAAKVAQLTAQLVAANAIAGTTAFSFRSLRVAWTAFTASLGPVGIAAAAIGVLAAAVASVALATEKSTANFSEFDATLKKLGSTNAAIAEDEIKLTALSDELAKSIESQGVAANAAKALEVSALTERIAKNKELAAVYKSLTVAQIGAGQAELQGIEEQQRKLTGVRRRRGNNSRIAQDTGQGLKRNESEANFKARQQAAFNKLLEEANNAVEAGVSLSGKQTKALQLAAQLEEQRLKIANSRSQLEALSATESVKAAKAATEERELDFEGLKKAQEDLAAAQVDLGKANELQATKEISRAKERLAIAERTVELIREGVSAEQSKRIATDEIKPGSPRRATEDPNTKIVERLTELRKTEEEQIEDLKQLRISAIKETTKEGQSRAQLIRAAEEEALESLSKLEADREKTAKALAADKAEASNKLITDAAEMLAIQKEVEASVARMHGRVLEASQLELEAAKARLQARAATGDETEQAAANAGIADISRQSDDLEKQALSDLDDLGRNEEGLQAELSKIAEAEEAKLTLLESYRTTELESLRNFEEIKAQIEGEAEQKRQAARFAALDTQIGAVESFASRSVSALRSAGAEGTKAMKIAAKAQQGIALGRAIVSSASAAASSFAAAGGFPFGIPAALASIAFNAPQIAAIASQTFARGGQIKGPGTGTSDDILARNVDNGQFIGVSNDEYITRAAVARRNLPGLKRMNAGQTPAQAFGLRGISRPALPQASGGGTTSIGGPSMVIQGNVDDGTLPRLQEMFDKSNREFVKRVNDVVAARERQTTPRSQRPVGRGR